MLQFIDDQASFAVRAALARSLTAPAGEALQGFLSSGVQHINSGDTQSTVDDK